jgi:hypothetical protein
MTPGSTSGVQATQRQPLGLDARLLALTNTSVRGYVAPGGHPVIPNKKGGAADVFISDAGTNTVYEYPATGGSPVETITGLNEPQGIAVDKAGNLYVANTGTQQILVFPPNSTTPSLTISETSPSEYPVGVTTDQKGNIWVSNILSTLSPPGAGDVAEFSSNGTPIQSLSCSAMQKYYFIAVDKNENVFVSGTQTTSGTGPEVVEFPAASSSCTVLSSVVVKFPGGLQLTKKEDLIVDDQTALNAKTYKAPDFTKVLSTTTFRFAQDPVTIAIVSGDKDIWTANAGGRDATEFAYPAGGNPILTISGLSEPIGVAVTPLAKGN